MSYLTDETSVESGQPVELYEFIGPDPVDNVFRYTSADYDVTFDPGDGGGSRTFIAIPINRTGVEYHPDGAAPSITVSLPVRTVENAGMFNLVARYVFSIAPHELYLTLFRAHIGVGTEEAIIAWEGDVISWTAEENTAKFVVPSDLVARVNEEVPRMRYQPFCNNILFDSICAIAKSGANVHATTVSSFSADGKTVTVPMAPKATGYADGGEIIHDATGESRMILAQVGNDLTILYPFSANVDVLDPVTIAVGCNHSLDDCVNKFSNEDNFNGFAFIASQATNTTQSGE